MENSGGWEMKHEIEIPDLPEGCEMTFIDSNDKWIWMMDYCKKNGIPPAQQWAWDRASKAYEDNKCAE
mgnify:FL=1